MEVDVGAEPLLWHGLGLPALRRGDLTLVREPLRVTRERRWSRIARRRRRAPPRRAALGSVSGPCVLQSSSMGGLFAFGGLDEYLNRDS